MSARIFVGNLSERTTQGEIQDLFAEVGEVVEVSVPTDRITGMGRGFAFLEFADEATATEAIEKMDGRELGGRSIRVTKSADRQDRGAPGGGGGGNAGYRAPNRPGGPKKSRPKGSRRNLRGKKRSL